MPNINGALEEWAQNLTLLLAARFFVDRGDANVGGLPKGALHAEKGPDCLHYCVAPGVLDALAMQTLATLYNLHNG